MRFNNTTPPEELIRLWRNLPIFRVIGGEYRLRKALLAQLEDISQARGLYCVSVCQNIPPNELVNLAVKADMVLVDEEVDTEFPLFYKIVLQEERAICQADGDVLWLSRNVIEGDLDAQFWPLLLNRLQNLVAATPVWACVLIGGKSSRMGQPKHLLTDKDGVSWLERVINLVSPLVSGVVLSGAGELPQALATIPRLADIPGVVGPLNGILAASRWQPLVSWLIIACDMPFVSRDAVSWLLTDRTVGEWGRIPHLAGDPHGEPLFSWYDMRAAQLFERQLFSGNMRSGAVAHHRKIVSPEIPKELAAAWDNVNTPEQLQSMYAQRR